MIFYVIICIPEPVEDSAPPISRRREFTPGPVFSELLFLGEDASMQITI